jgi:uncharacterized membrane protein YccC
MTRWPGIDEWLFTAKTFAAAMLALYIAFSIGLDRPYWALATVYIVSQPLSGSLRSRALYRLLGTLIGATATVVLVPNLANAPELLSIAMALWSGLCIYLALLDRTPRSYVFLLAGYTAALTGFPAVSTPDGIWDIALSRVEEIGLGIICSTVIGSVVFPRPLGPLLSARILTWVSDISTWTEDVLDGRVGAGNAGGRIRLAADAVELRMLASQLAYDTSRMQAATRWVVELQRRMVLLLPLLSSVGDRLAALRTANGVTPQLERLLSDLRVWMRAGAPPPRQEAERLRENIAWLEAETDPLAGWNAVMRDGVLRRLRELVDVRQDMRELRQHIQAGGGPLSVPLAVRTQEPELLHRDHGLAMLSGLAAVVTILVVCAFWIGTGWQAGSGATGIAAAGCSLFAAWDDPTPALKAFLFSTALAVLAVGIGLFGILPYVHEFEMLGLALGMFFVPLGLLMAVPSTQPLGTGLAFITATLLSLQSTYKADFVSYADGGFAVLVGVACAAIITALIRSVGAEWSARRLLRANWRDLAAIPGHQTPREYRDRRNLLAGLLLDRLGLLVPRLAAVGIGNDLAAVDVLMDLRVGINMVDLRHDRDAMPATVRAAVDDVLLGAASRFAIQAAEGRVKPSPPALLRDIDRALDMAIAMPGEHARDLLPPLVGIRLGLFADAAPYIPTPPPPDRQSVGPQASVAT